MGLEGTSSDFDQLHFGLLSGGACFRRGFEESLIQVAAVTGILSTMWYLRASCHRISVDSGNRSAPSPVRPSNRSRLGSPGNSEVLHVSLDIFGVVLIASGWSSRFLDLTQLKVGLGRKSPGIRVFRVLLIASLAKSRALCNSRKVGVSPLLQAVGFVFGRLGKRIGQEILRFLQAGPRKVFGQEELRIGSRPGLSLVGRNNGSPRKRERRLRTSPTRPATVRLRSFPWVNSLDRTGRRIIFSKGQRRLDSVRFFNRTS